MTIHNIDDKTTSALGLAFITSAKRFMGMGTKPSEPAANAEIEAITTLDHPPGTPAVTEITNVFGFIDSLATVTQARRFVMWSVANALNAMIIGQLQSHLRKVKRGTRQDAEHNPDLAFLKEHMDEQTLQKYIEQKDAIAAMVEANKARFDQGFDDVMQAEEIAEILVNVRRFVATRMEILATSARELAQSIGESIEYRLRGVPKADERKVMQLHLLTKWPVAEIRKIQIGIQVGERDEMIESMGTIIEMAETLEWKHILLSEDSVDAEIAKLPVHTQYKLLGAIIRSLNGAMTQEMKALLRFNRVDAISNKLLIEATFDAYKAMFVRFGEKHSDALLAYEERGFQLPTIESLLADRGN